MNVIELDQVLTLSELASIAEGRSQLQLSRSARERLCAGAAQLERLVAQGALVYGITTGYGPLAGNYVHEHLGGSLQRKLVYHLATGVGALFSQRETRAIMVARIANLAQGWSGVRPAVVDHLLAMLNQDIIPAVPQLGTVGASGDLTPLAHIALAAIGEGQVLGNGDLQDAASALERAGLHCLDLALKDGLALVNGTSAMTGVAALNGVDARRAFELAMRLTLGYGELMGARLEAWSPRLAIARPHPGQRHVAERLNLLSQDAPRLQPQQACSHSLPEALENTGLLHHQPIPQDPYTLRCAPQELGAAFDVLEFHDQLVATELMAACDNPIVDVEQGTLWHGGNFYGQHLAYAADSLTMAVIKVGVYIERIIARLTDPALNQGLPPFLTGGRPGLDSGFMGAQVTATALVAEMRTHAMPASIQSIATNANNQDVVTLGTIAARRCRDMLELLWKLLAIEAMVVAQGMDLVGQGSVATFSTSSRDIHRFVRHTVPFLTEDRPLSHEIERLADQLAKDG
ncbi:MAG: aromatic amino acid lyase [Chromatiaceae bacterium]|nr:aromatic amino acid lyase [Chromatiaceae bacterium]